MLDEVSNVQRNSFCLTLFSVCIFSGTEVPLVCAGVISAGPPAIYPRSA